MLWLQILFVLVLLGNTAVSPLKAFYEKGMLIKDVSLILKRYLKLSVYLDVIAILAIVIPLAIQNVNSNWIKILWFIMNFKSAQMK